MDRHPRLTLLRAGYAALLCVAALVCPARAEYRHALVIGNAAYPATPLASPERDARAVGKAFRKRGFTVTEAMNLTTEKLRETVADFAVAVPTRGTAVVYFAGACVPTVPMPQPAPNPAVKQDSLLLAIDSGDPAKPWQLRMNGMTARQVLAQLATEFRDRPRDLQSPRRQGGSLTNILILDGCYPVAWLPSGALRGLAKSGTLAPESMIISAADYGATIEPVKKGLSPLATQLVAELGSSKPLDAVLAAVGGQRESTLGDLSFLGEPASRSVSPPTELSAGTKPGDEWVNDCGMVFCWCPPGSFTIGTGPVASRQSPWDEQTDEPLADVEFPQGFWIGKYECTLRDMLARMPRSGQFSVGTHKLHPMNQNLGAHYEGMIAKLNETAPAGWSYDMPTEAEWEYAARAGSRTVYSFGDDPADLGRHGNFADRTLRESASKGQKGDSARALPDQPTRDFTGLFGYAHDSWTDGHATAAIVGSYPPNAWGLHDVHGNVCELTSTPYHAARVPLPMPDSPNARAPVTKGGSWLSVASYCRSAFRGRLSRVEDENFEGLRLVLRRKSDLAPRTEPKWTTLLPTKVTSTAGAEATIAADGSVLVNGKPVKDTYVVETTVPKGMTPRAIRLEPLADASLPANGAVRDGKGRFTIGEFSARFGVSGSNRPQHPVTFLHTMANGGAAFPVAAATDGRPETVWITNTDHPLIVLLRLPSRQGPDGAVWRHPARSSGDAFPAASASLTITLDLPNNAFTWGKFRLSVTEDDVSP